MATTTVRVDTDTHAKLLEISKASGVSLIETIRDATEALQRRRFAEDVVEQLSALRDDPVAWRGYLAEAAETSVADGIAR